MTDFYETIFEVQPTSTATTSDGGTVLSFVLPGATVAIQYVNRPAGGDGAHSTAWFQARGSSPAVTASVCAAGRITAAATQNYLNAVNEHYQTSYKVRKTPSWPRSWPSFSLLCCIPAGMHGPT
jgi:hypothetical protein